MGMLKKVGIFWGRQILKLGFFWGIKYEPLSDPPPPSPPSLKYVSGGPGLFYNVDQSHHKTIEQHIKEL